MPHETRQSTPTQPKNRRHSSTSNQPNTNQNQPPFTPLNISEITDFLTNKLNDTDAQIPIKYIRNLENQLNHSQQLGSINRITSEIIHDFNNILGTILGYTSILKNQFDPKTENYEYTHLIELSSQQAKILTRQLLDSSRKEYFTSNSLNVNEIITDLHTILSKTLRKEITIKIKTQNDIPTIHGNKSQIHQVLMNLCINASDAISNKGTITITSETTLVPRTIPRDEPNTQPTKHIKITVSDDGTGIDPSIKNRIFEPFFTTKDEGKGTGLGLSLVKTILDKHHSYINFQTETYKGTTFTILLPINYKPDQP